MTSAEYVFALLNDVGLYFVMWVFAVKYWIVSRKVQLYQADLGIENYQRKFAFILYGGLIIIFLLLLTSTTINYYKLANPELQFSPWVFWSYYAVISSMIFLVPALFLLDGFRRTRNALREGESISNKFIKLTIGAYGF